MRELMKNHIHINHSGSISQSGSGNMAANTGRGNVTINNFSFDIFGCWRSKRVSVSSWNGLITIKRGSDTFTYHGNNAQIKGNRWFIDGVEVKISDSDELKNNVVELGDVVYEKLVRLTNNYLDKKDLSPAKQALFQHLKAVLEGTGQLSKYQRICAFKEALQIADKNLVALHRTDTWKRYLYNAFSLLTLLPAFIRAVNSYSQHGTLQFWKPTSQKTIECCTNEIENWSKANNAS